MTAATPNVELWAHTAVTPDLNTTLPRQPHTTDSEHLIVAAGRACYQSFNRPNPATRDDGDYITRTIFQQRHGSIMEHATATVYITGVSRAFLAEITRHRHLSFSVQSQRFVDEADANIVVPPAIRDALNGRAFISVTDYAEALDAIHNAYTGTVELLEVAGYGRKQAREAARAFLPNATETRMVVTGNLRAWRNVVDLRTADGVDAEMSEVMSLVEDTLHDVAPNIFPRREALAPANN